MFGWPPMSLSEQRHWIEIHQRAVGWLGRCFRSNAPRADRRYFAYGKMSRWAIIVTCTDDLRPPLWFCIYFAEGSQPSAAIFKTMATVKIETAERSHFFVSEMCEPPLTRGRIHGRMCYNGYIVQTVNQLNSFGREQNETDQ